MFQACSQVAALLNVGFLWIGEDTATTLSPNSEGLNFTLKLLGCVTVSYKKVRRNEFKWTNSLFCRNFRIFWDIGGNSSVGNKVRLPGVAADLWAEGKADRFDVGTCMTRDAGDIEDWFGGCTTWRFEVTAIIPSWIWAWSSEWVGRMLAGFPLDPVYQDHQGWEWWRRWVRV